MVLAKERKKEFLHPAQDGSKKIHAGRNAGGNPYHDGERLIEHKHQPETNSKGDQEADRNQGGEPNNDGLSARGKPTGSGQAVTTRMLRRFVFHLYGRRIGKGGDEFHSIEPYGTAIGGGGLLKGGGEDGGGGSVLPRGISRWTFVGE